MKKFILGFLCGAILFTVVGVLAAEYNIYPNPYKILVDGQEKQIEGYNINGYSYFKLRDIGDVTDFDVDFINDEIVINTNKSSMTGVTQGAENDDVPIVLRDGITYEMAPFEIVSFPSIKNVDSNIKDVTWYQDNFELGEKLYVYPYNANTFEKYKKLLIEDGFKQQTDTEFVKNKTTLGFKINTENGKQYLYLYAFSSEYKYSPLTSDNSVSYINGIAYPLFNSSCGYQPIRQRFSLDISQYSFYYDPALFDFDSSLDKFLKRLTNEGYVYASDLIFGDEAGIAFTKPDGKITITIQVAYDNTICVGVQYSDKPLLTTNTGNNQNSSSYESELAAINAKYDSAISNLQTQKRQASESIMSNAGSTSVEITAAAQAAQRSDESYDAKIKELEAKREEEIRQLKKKYNK